jgi:hypothetical protein
MSTNLRSRLLLGLLCAGLAWTFLVALPYNLAHAPQPGEGSDDLSLADSSGSFTIAGTTTESISPGLGAPLNLKLTNTQTSPMVIHDLQVTVTRVQAPNADTTHPCSLSDFIVRKASTSQIITIAPQSTSTLSNLGLPIATWPRVGMLNRPVDQDGCKGAQLTLAFAASGTVEH